MRAREFVREALDGKLPPSEEKAATEVIKMRDDGIDRANHLNRVMMAAAMSDGKGTGKVDMDPYSWAERFNTAHPYTKEESNMVKSALNTVGGTFKDLVTDPQSTEADDTNKASPVVGFKGYKRK